MRFSFALFFLAASPLFASYSSFINDNLTTINTTTWAQNGTLAAGSSGLTSSSSTGGSLIYKGSALSGKQEYEVRTTYHLTQSGGTFITYLEATQNAQYGASTGTYYALALINPTFSGGTCTAGLSLYRGGSSPATLFSYPSVSCYDGMIIRLVYGNSNQMIVYFGVYTGVQSADHSGYSAWAQDSTLGAAAPGIGVINSPAGNTISNVQVFQPDLTAPGTVNAQSIGTSVFSNHVDFQWQGVTDDTNGSGLAFYQIARNGTTFYDAADAEFSDATVSPSTTYSYTIYASDFYLNSSSTTVSVVTPPTGDIDPREVGVRRQGAYWGGGGEQIDMRSGNVNYTLPVVTVMGRAGLGISLALTNNSQNWRQDPAGIWQMGRDVGYGYGWKLQAGALLPVWNTSYSVDHYLFIDGSGAEYRLDQTTGNGVWTSKQGIYLSFNAGGQNLYFPDGSHWNFGCISAGTEDDAGTMYPTLIEDRNGNQITLAYAAGRGGVTWTNSSGRITQVGDSVGMNAYVFNYNTDSIPHLTGILDYRSGSGQFTFAYNSLALTAPFTPATGYGTWSVLASATQNNSGRFWSFGYDSSGSGEIAQATMPEGGSLGWVYGPSTYYGSRTQREAQTRNLVMSAGATPLAYTIYHYDGQPTDTVHGSMTVDDADGHGEKSWAFQVDTSQQTLGLPVSYVSRLNHYPATAGERVDEYVYSYDSAGNPYVSTAATTVDTGNAAATTMERTQALDGWGNVTSASVYDYGYTTGSYAIRAYTNTFVTTSAYTNLNIYNLLSTSQIADHAGYGATLVSNTFDVGSLAAATASPLNGHDSAYGTSFTTRGRVTSQTTPAGTKTASFDITGAVVSASDGTTSVAMTPDSTANAVPTAITPNSNSNLATSIAYTGWLAPSTVTGPNSATASTTYDVIGRPLKVTSVTGAFTNATYTNFSASTAPATVLADVWDTSGSTQTKVRYTLSTLDGFGRTVRVERGYYSSDQITQNAVSWVDTVYGPCGCSPLGKVTKVSLPYAPHGTASYTTYAYDGLGRTMTETLADGSVTAYTYSGNTVKITDPAGHWKTYTTDALGNLTNVLEPDPVNGNVNTSYTYDVLNHLTGVTMIRGTTTQTRTFNYTTGTSVGAYLLSATNPENGTVIYVYNADGTLKKKSDAKSQETRYTYDSLKRVTKVQRGTYTGTWPTETFAPVAVQETDFTYDSATGCANGYGHLCKVTYTGTNADAPSGLNADAYTELLSYTAPGQLTSKQWSVYRSWTSTASATVNLSEGYTWDSEGRMATISYPPMATCAGGLCGSGTTNGPTYSYGYDSMGRRLNMTRTDVAPSQSVADTTVYNLADQMTSLNMPNTSTAETETRAYNSLFQLSELIQKAGSTTTLMDLQYNYPAGANNGKISKVVDNVSGETVSYQYDSLNRLISAVAKNTSSGTQIWGNSFTFDGFGNLTNKTVTWGSAPSLSQMVDGTTNRIVGYNYDANGNQTTIPVPGTGNVTPTYDIENRMIQLGTSGKYAYNHSNQRVWKKTTSEYFYFYGLDGKRAATYTVTVTGPSSGVAAVQLTASDMPVYYGSKLLMVGSYNGISFTAAYVGVDRLGSVPGGTKLYAWGEEVTQTANEKTKFATYWRDGESGIDYAMSRYYNTSAGRFFSADPFAGSAHGSRPQSWNRYSYSVSDPINGNDPSGLCTVMDAGIGMNGSGSDNPDFANFANSIGADTVYPYLGNYFEDGFEVGLQAQGAVLPSTVLADAGFSAASNDVGSMTGVFYSGGAQAAMTAAAKDPLAVQNLDYVFYVSPGLGGNLGDAPFILGNKGTYVIYDPTSEKDMDAGGPHLAALLATPGVTVLRADGCRHSFGCMMQKYGSLIRSKAGPPCQNRHVFSRSGKPVSSFLSSFYLLELLGLQSATPSSPEVPSDDDDDDEIAN